MSITVQKVISNSIEKPDPFLREALHTGQSTFLYPVFEIQIPVEDFTTTINR